MGPEGPSTPGCPVNPRGPRGLTLMVNLRASPENNTKEVLNRGIMELDSKLGVILDLVTILKLSTDFPKCLFHSAQFRLHSSNQTVDISASLIRSSRTTRWTISNTTNTWFRIKGSIDTLCARVAQR
mmetsp:Transcript_65860/g.176475  ORF Transcript_65860/g.176475 Transcript_65860/m.176475 type:complete len:127 (+) Transcript_65860:302-682(+)